MSFMLGMRESYEDGQALGRDLIAYGLGAPMLIVADGVSRLIKAIERCWPASHRQRCCVHRVRNLLAKLPERERERVRQAYCRSLADAINDRDAKQQLQALADQLETRVRERSVMKGETRGRDSAQARPNSLHDGHTSRTRRHGRNPSQTVRGMSSYRPAAAR